MGTPEEEKKRAKRLCKCCGLDPDAKSLPLCCSTDKLKFLGPGFLMLFTLIKFMIIITSLLCIPGTIKIITTIAKGVCVSSSSSSSVCVTDWITITSVANYGIGEVDHLNKVKKKLINFRDLYVHMLSA